MRTGGDNMGLLEWFGLKKRELVVCPECEHYISPDERESEKSSLPACAFLSHEVLNYTTGKSKIEYVSCFNLNRDGKCKHFTRKVMIMSECEECTEYISPYCNLWNAGTTFARTEPEFKFECAECKHYISSYCGICNASTNITGTEQKVNEPRSVLNADKNCRFFIPSFVDSE